MHPIRGLSETLQKLTGPLVEKVANSWLISFTIWRPGLFGTPTDRYANLYRLILPLFDLVVISTGWRAIWFGVPAFTDVTGGEAFGDWWGLVLVIGGNACLLGITFPKLFVFELWGKVILFATLCVYSATMLYLSAGHGGDSRSVLSSIATLAVFVPAWRLGDIATERRIRLNNRAAQRDRPAQ